MSEGPFTFRLAPFPVAAIFIAVFVLDADLHTTAGPLFIVVPLVVSSSVCAVPVSIALVAPVSVSSLILVAAIIITVATHSRVGTHFAVFATNSVAVAATHSPIAPHLTIIDPRLVAIAPLIPLLLGILVRLCRNCLRRRNRWSFSLLLSEGFA